MADDGPGASKKPWVGRDVPRREGRDKVTGRAQYIDDVVFDDVMYGATVRSPVARGKLKGLHFGEGVDWDSITVVTAADVTGANEVRLLQADQPLLADGVINHAEEPIALIAHPDREVVVRALRAITVDIEPMDSVHTIDDALAPTHVVWGTDNVFTEYKVGRGDVEAAMEGAHLVLSGSYTTGAQEQMYIEPQGMVARWQDGGVTIWGSLQCPYYVQTAVAPMFGLPEDKVRVVQAVTGGGFGGKEEYPSIVAGHAALLAKKTGTAVKLIYDRIEDVTATTKRHPSATTIRSAVDAQGRLLALDIDFVIDGGAYVTLSPVVLSRGTIHAAGPYRCDNVSVRSRAVATNTPPHGAFRGFGAPQSIFALERHLDRVATALQMDPAELRRVNLLRQGDTTAVGQTIAEPIDLGGVLDTALNSASYREKMAEAKAFNAKAGPLRKGVGIASFYHGSGFTGAGEVHLASSAQVRACADGSLLVLAASTEIGQGTNTIFSQMAADAAKIDPGRVLIQNPDTAKVPNSGPTVASRTCMVVGNLITRATQQVVAKFRAHDLLAAEYDDAEWARACAAYAAEHGELTEVAHYQPPAGVSWDEANFRGDAYAHYAWAVYIAAVTVDTRTAETTVDDFVAVQEIGKTVNPIMAEGQIEGGVAQAIGWAIFEDVVWREGKVANPQMTNYIIPTAVDTPPIRVTFAKPFAADPVAKGIGELPMDGPAPAVISAVAMATQTDPCDVPLMPERLMEHLHG